MKAMILAAGKGTRMRPITLTTPKPMIPLARKPVMETIIEHLRRYEVRDIVINTSYLPEVIQNYFTDGAPWDVNLTYSFEGHMSRGELVGEALGSAGGLKKIQEFSGFFDDTFVVLCGDAYIDFDVKALYDFHKSKNSIATILLRDVPKEETFKYGVVATSPDGKILQFQEKPTPEEAVSTTINTGIYMFEPEILDHIPVGREYDIGGELFPDLVAAGAPFYGLLQDFQWLDIGSLPDYFECQSLLLQGKVDGFDLPGTEVKPGVRLGINTRVDLDQCDIQGPVYIASGSEVQAGAKIIGPTMVGANCVVESGVTLERCVTDNFKRICRGAHLTDLVLHDRHAINKNGEHFDLKDLRCEWMVDDTRNSDELDEFQELVRRAANQ